MFTLSKSLEITVWNCLFFGKFLNIQYLILIFLQCTKNSNTIAKFILIIFHIGTLNSQIILHFVFDLTT